MQENDHLEHILLDVNDPDDEVMAKFFEPQKVIGEGAFSIVISAYDKLSKSQVAIKILNKDAFKKSQTDMLLKEATILKKLNHPNIVRMKMSKETKCKLFIVLEEIKGKTLEKYIEKRKLQNKPLLEHEIKSITIQIVKAIKHIHEKDIIHRDLKPENILIEEIVEQQSGQSIEEKINLKIRIIDFGLSIQLESQVFQPLHDNCGTLLFMAPEVAFGKEYNKSIDIWSLGIIVFIMYSMGKHPFWTLNDNKKTFYDKLKNPFWSFWPENIDKKACNFITKTATRRSEFRMSAQQSLRHPWLLGQGELGEPITMGDMITTFSNMQQLSRAIKGILFLKYLMKEMENQNGLIKQKFSFRDHLKKISNDTPICARNVSIASSFNRPNSGGQVSDQMTPRREKSKLSNSDQESYVRSPRNFQKQSFKIQKSQQSLCKMSPQMKKSTTNPTLPIFYPKGDPQMEQSGLKQTKSQHFIEQQIFSTPIQLTKIKTDQFKNVVQSTLYHRVEQVNGEKMYQSIVFQTKKSKPYQILNPNHNQLTENTIQRGIKQNIQVPQGTKFPSITQKPPLLKHNSHIVKDLSQSPKKVSLKINLKSPVQLKYTEKARNPTLIKPQLICNDTININ